MLGPSEQPSPNPPLLEAYYYNGKSAVRHKVAVRLSESALDILLPSGETMTRWLYDVIVFADKSSGGVRVAKADSEERLVFLDQAAFEALRSRAPNMYTSQKRIRRGMALAIATTIVFLVGVYFVTPTLTAVFVALTPLSYEAKLGKRYAGQISSLLEDGADKKTCQGVHGLKALDKLVQALAQHAPVLLPYHVQVLDVKMVNAMALPGGYIFVFRGLLDQAESQDELAGVLAHEMAHAQLRHPMHAMVRRYGVSMMSDMMFGGSVMGGVSKNVMMTAYSREAEQEADALAVQTLQSAHIDANGLANFFKRLSKEEEKSRFELPGFMSTHPDTASRARHVESAKPGGLAVLQDEEWTNLKAVCS
ncbi:hypothetical protein BEN30_11765 [Magnetovibrio blakemorei]|uniref:Uncharacterized protein n=2 Tax=Magnetovibrio blakemorei TaxID=28181 RepID=A0A1E5Q6V4_9PROT|nr:hypothetical protein BEN30_11765 [Magnetovibrio blakemorei]